MSEYINNSEKRKEALRSLILDLHAGGDLEEIKARFRKLIGEVTAVQVAQLEQSLIDEGLPVEEVKALCDVHVSVFQESLEGDLPPARSRREQPAPVQLLPRHENAWVRRQPRRHQPEGLRISVIAG